VLSTSFALDVHLFTTLWAWRAHTARQLILVCCWSCYLSLVHITWTELNLSSEHMQTKENVHIVRSGVRDLLRILVTYNLPIKMGIQRWLILYHSWQYTWLAVPPLWGLPSVRKQKHKLSIALSNHWMRLWTTMDDVSRCRNMNEWMNVIRWTYDVGLSARYRRDWQTAVIKNEEVGNLAPCFVKYRPRSVER